MNGTPVRAEFLGRLADQAFGAPPMLQPRKPSLFEPVPLAPSFDEVTLETLAEEAPRVAQAAPMSTEPQPRIDAAPVLETSRPVPRREHVPAVEQEPPGKSRDAPEAMVRESRIDMAPVPETPRPTPRREHIPAVGQERLGKWRDAPEPMVRESRQTAATVQPGKSREALEPTMHAPQQITVTARPAETRSPNSVQTQADAPRRVAALVPSVAPVEAMVPARSLMPQETALDPIAPRRMVPLERQSLAQRSEAQESPTLRARATEAEERAVLVAQPLAREIGAALASQASVRESAPTDAPAAAQSSPIVNVTIGRVEVRAAGPAETRTPKRAEKRSMSLDEYLKRRSNS